MTERGRAGSLVALALCGIVAGDAAADGAAPEPTVRGRVEAVTSRWTAGGHEIVSDVVVRMADGQQVVVTTPGGAVGGLGMTFSHHDAALRSDDEVVLIPERHGVRMRRVASARVTPTHPLAADAPRVGVQRTTLSLRSLYHPTGCINFVYDGDGTTQLANDAEWTAVDAAFAAWQGASEKLTCGGLSFGRQVVPHAPDGRDGTNTIHFRDDTWCRPGSITEAAVCHSSQAVAVTRTLYIDDPASPRDGEILEVDIDVNAVDFALATDGRAAAIDLASAMAHEIGHALGLDHNCGVEDAAWPTAADGTPVASCESLSPELGGATMYFQVAPGTVTMRTPEASDVDGLCAVVDGTCEQAITNTGCAAGGDASAAPLVFAGLFAGLFAGRRRRRLKHDGWPLLVRKPDPDRVTFLHLSPTSPLQTESRARLFV